jgi:hypothetical protein
VCVQTKCLVTCDSTPTSHFRAHALTSDLYELTSYLSQAVPLKADDPKAVQEAHTHKCVPHMHNYSIRLFHLRSPLWTPTSLNSLLLFEGAVLTARALIVEWVSF